MHRASEPDRAWRLPGPIPSFYREENRSIEEKGFAQGHPGSGWQSWNWAFEWENVTYSLSPHFSGSCLAAPSPWPHLSLNKYLLNTYYLPDNVRDPEETAVDKTNQTPTQVELTFSFNPNTHLLHLRSRHKLSCCNLKGLVRKNRSAHMRAVQATGPFPWKKRSISWEWPKSFPSATYPPTHENPLLWFLEPPYQPDTHIPILRVRNWGQRRWRCWASKHLDWAFSFL